MKVAVEVVDARDLLSKNGHGTASPYVEVELDGQRRRTQTKRDDLNPTWNETLFFDVSDPLDLPRCTIHVSVLHHRDSPTGTSGSFLGRVRLSGSSVAPSKADAAIQRCPLDRRPGLPFSRVRGDIALRLYTVLNDRPPPPPPLRRSRAVDFSTAYSSAPSTAPPRSRATDFSTAYASAPSMAPTENEQKEEKKKRRSSTTRTFHSIGSQFGGTAGPMRFDNRDATPPAVGAEV